MARVTVRLMGGLGNQLFQLAHALNLMEVNSSSVDLDLSWFDRPSRGMTPRTLDVPIEVLPLPVTSSPRWIWHGKFGAWTGEGNEGRLAPVAAGMKRRYEMGYWQSSASVESARAPMEQLIRGVESARGSLGTCADYVAVHIRRGDYASDERTKRFHGLTDADGQMKLARRLADERGIEDVRVFTDTPDDVRQVVKATAGAGVDDSVDSWDAMLRMSRARVLITCNSSLSWWAGVYGGWVSEDRIDVFVPAPWLAEPSELDQALPLAHWNSYPRQVLR